MKKIILTLICLLAFGFSNAQNFKGHASGTIGFLNPKIRLQYEHPLGSIYSTGANLNYYMVNWKGPIIEPFLRWYVADSNASGGFFQAKAGYGNLSSLDESKNWSTYGGGIAWGYKYAKSSGFTIEPIVGLRIYSAPQDEQTIGDVVENVGWAVTTGLPIDFQLKFGYQF